MTDTGIHQKFNDSFDRCKNDTQFFEDFYTIFFSKSDEIKQKFHGVDMRHQKKMLQKTLPLLMMAHTDSSLLFRLAINHNADHLNIKPHLYTFWLDSLVEAASICDDYFDTETEQAWRIIMRPGINYMISKYEYGGST